MWVAIEPILLLIRLKVRETFKKLNLGFSYFRKLCRLTPRNTLDLISKCNFIILCTIINRHNDELAYTKVVLI